MDLIAGRKKVGITSGFVFFGEDLGVQDPFDIAYVQSADVHIGEFTVRQNLYYSCKLRLGSISEDLYNKRVVEAASAVGRRATHTIEFECVSDFFCARTCS